MIARYSLSSLLVAVTTTCPLHPAGAFTRASLLFVSLLVSSFDAYVEVSRSLDAMHTRTS